MRLQVKRFKVPSTIFQRPINLAIRVTLRLSLAFCAALLCACDGGSKAAQPVSYGSDRLVSLDHGGFKLLYDCDLHSALRYDYTLDKDTGNAARPSSFKLDPTLPAGCAQQTSTASYASVVPGWDRGHLVTSNHMDTNAEYILRANYMTNIVPQASTFNQGIWLAAENVAECYRDLTPLRVVGGVVYSDIANDYFVTSHGIPTPEYFWKVILSADKAIAWYIPNRSDLASLDSYLVSITELEGKLGVAMVDAPQSLKASRATWKLPAGCSLS